jgi:para-aminobenzoate synthetase component 1
LLRAGDCYQLNLTRRLYAAARCDPIALFGRIATRHPAPYTALVTIGGPSVVSASPELFLRYDAGAIESRPIKGTGRTTRALVASEKDRIENVMIVDLVRNDLDRVCAPGTVQVAALCEPEQHPGLVHLVSRVTGGLRPDVDVVDILSATFPPASITGIPKASVLRSIEALEPVRRGAYCGAVGWFDTDANRGELAVAIRTFTVLTDELRLGVGGGITIASDADDEWRETELKAARLLSLVDDVAVPAEVTDDAYGHSS